MKPETERVAASVLIELADGRITVKHGQSGELLRVLDNAPAGTWSGIFAALDALGVTE